MAEPPVCENCAYSDDGASPADPSDGVWLLCRRWAPRAFCRAEDGYTGAYSGFPRVARDDWCGEWVQCRLKTGGRRPATYLARQLERREEIDD
jgi:hypothetical protein